MMNPYKRKLYLIVFGLICIILTYIFNGMLPSIFMHLGKKAYDQKDYQRAYKDLDFALKLNPLNPNIRYYFVKTLIQMRPTLEVQRDLYETSQNNFSDSADVIAEQQIQAWKDQILFKVGDNYIEQVPFDNKILRWDAKTFPIKVNINNLSKNTVPVYYINEIQKAFLQWQNDTSDFIKFQFVNNPNDAQIVVKIVTDDQRQSCTTEECKYVAAFTEPFLKKNLLDKMIITIYDKNTKDNFLGQKQLYNTILHEIGHSLGIMGHSYNPDDLMYMERNELTDNPDGSNDVDNLKYISSADLNTLILLYELIPDITNTPWDKFDTSHQFFSPIIIGSDEEITSRKMLEAQNYIKNAPNIPNGYIDLAAAYSDQKEYSKAITTLNKALRLSHSNNEKYIVYYNLAIVFMNIREWDTALDYAGKAKALSDASQGDIDGLIAGINFNKGDREFAKEKYIETLEKNPQNTIDAINLAKIYLKEFNFVEAGRTLHRLVRANPKAQNDPKVKSFGLLMFFFR